MGYCAGSLLWEARPYRFCSSSLARSTTSSGLSSLGEQGVRGGEDRVVEEEAVVCREEGVATWLAI